MPCETPTGYVVRDARDCQCHSRLAYEQDSRACTELLVVCTFSSEVKGSHLTHLLRPELVKQFQDPLCPDAYSMFTDLSFNAPIDAATRHLQVGALTWPTDSAANNRLTD
jgi:hypothetical protein